MLIDLTEQNAPRAYTEALWKMHIYGKEGMSRNGKVIYIPTPFFLTIERPQERVIFDPYRDCNPFFHVMEFCWMLAGSNDAKWISQFNKRMLDYADDGYLRGAYGWRWANPTDQITQVINQLREDPETRQSVLSMWDPVLDGYTARTSDRPCNTHIYFRVNAGRLDMTVCNRSNDMIWGMFGANVVHMTLLHELISLAAMYEQGKYQVFTNNLHVYPEMPRFDEIYRQTGDWNYYENVVDPEPLLQGGENWKDLREDCMALVHGGLHQLGQFRTKWMQNVALPMYLAYLHKGGHRDHYITHIAATDWRVACEQWVQRRKDNSERLRGYEVPHVSVDSD